MTDDDDNAVVCSEERADGLLERITGDHRSLLQLQLYDVSDRDSGQSAVHLSPAVYSQYPSLSKKHFDTVGWVAEGHLAC